MDKKKISFFAVGMLTGALIASVFFAFFARHDTRDGSRIVLRLAHVLDQSHPVHKGMEFMALRVAELSGGTVDLQIFPNGQLGSETENIEQLQRGALAICKTSTASLENFIPQIAVFGIPYIFRDEDHGWKVLDGAIGKELLEMGAEHGLRGLCYFDAGARSFYTTSRPINHPDDLRGLKIRVLASRTAMDMVSAMGAAPTPIPWGELYTALQQGMVDGAENNPPSLWTSRHFEVCRFYSLNEHTRVPDILLISRPIWDGLPTHVQAWLMEAAEEASYYQRHVWKEASDQMLADLEAAGVTINRPDKGPFAERVRGMQATYDGTEIGDLMNRIMEVR